MFRGPRNGPNANLDLVPVMNLVSILIPFLLLGAGFVNLAVVEVSLPPTKEAPVDVELPVALDLVVDITQEGMRVSGAPELGDEGLFIPCHGPCGADRYDYAALKVSLRRIKDEHPSQDSLVLRPAGSVPYEVLVGAMDTARAETMEEGGRVLFPHQSVAGR